MIPSSGRSTGRSAPAGHHRPPAPAAAPPHATGSPPGVPPIARIILIAGLTGALGFLALTVVRDYSLARGDHETVARLESGARDIARALAGMVQGDTSADAAPALPPLRRPTDPRIRILKSLRVLQLLDGRTVVAEWQCRLGSNPTGRKLSADDGRTPEGHYYVAARDGLNARHRRLEISYPSIEDAERGLAAGLVNHGQVESVRRAVQTRKAPDPGTALGGRVGIHGTGGPMRGDDWTDGSIALSDEAIEQLFRVIEPGDPVEIRP